MNKEKSTEKKMEGKILKILFCLEEISQYPIGGYKVIYEYANRLVDDENDVTIIHKNANKNSLRNIITKGIRRAAYDYIHKNDIPEWIKLDKRVKICVLNAYNQYKKKSDICIATGIGTIEETERLSSQYGTKFYFVQGYEVWGGGKEFVAQSYKKDFKIITISKGLQELIYTEAGKDSYKVPNAINHRIFDIRKKIEDRNPKTLCTLYSDAESKGFKYVWESVLRLKEKYPDITLKMFGTSQQMENWPDWVSYKQNASEEDVASLLNDSAIYICGSVNEGFGLTALEAMACGTALITTNHYGAGEYAVDGETALVVKMKNTDALYNAMLRLVGNPKLINKLAYNGKVKASEFTWEKSYELFKKSLVDGIEG